MVELITLRAVVILLIIIIFVTALTNKRTLAVLKPQEYGLIITLNTVTTVTNSPLVLVYPVVQKIFKNSTAPMQISLEEHSVSFKHREAFCDALVKGIQVDCVVRGYENLVANFLYTPNHDTRTALLRALVSTLTEVAGSKEILPVIRNLKREYILPVMAKLQEASAPWGVRIISVRLGIESPAFLDEATKTRERAAAKADELVSLSDAEVTTKVNQINSEGDNFQLIEFFQTLVEIAKQNPNALTALNLGDGGLLEAIFARVNQKRRQEDDRS